MKKVVCGWSKHLVLFKKFGFQHLKLSSWTWRIVIQSCGNSEDVEKNGLAALKFGCSFLLPFCAYEQFDQADNSGSKVTFFFYPQRTSGYQNVISRCRKQIQREMSPTCVPLSCSFETVRCDTQTPSLPLKYIQWKQSHNDCFILTIISDYWYPLAELMRKTIIGQFNIKFYKD